MPLYRARPPLTPPSILSVLLRRSCERGGRPGGGGGGGSQAGGSAVGGAGGGADVMPEESSTARPEDHRGSPGFDPGCARPFVPGDHRCSRAGSRCDDRHREHPCRGRPGRRGAVPPAAGAPRPGARAPPPPLARPRQGRVLAGVAAGTAAHLRQDPLVVRAAFVVLAALGIGIVLYGLLWLTMPVAEPGAEPVVSLVPGAPRSTRQVLGLAALAVVGAIVVGQLLSSFDSNVVLPLVLVAAGLAVIWRQLDADRTLARP